MSKFIFGLNCYNKVCFSGRHLMKKHVNLCIILNYVYEKQSCFSCPMDDAGFIDVVVHGIFRPVELMIEPSLPSDTLPLRMEVVSIVQPAMLLLEPSCATQYPALSVV